MTTNWQLWVLAAFGLFVIERALRQIAQVLIGIRARLTAVQNTQAMLFYTVERIYEMSGLYERFKSSKSARAR